MLSYLWLIRILYQPSNFVLISLSIYPHIMCRVRSSGRVYVSSCHTVPRKVPSSCGVVKPLAYSDYVGLCGLLAGIIFANVMAPAACCALPAVIASTTPHRHKSLLCARVSRHAARAYMFGVFVLA